MKLDFRKHYFPFVTVSRQWAGHGVCFSWTGPDHWADVMDQPRSPSADSHFCVCLSWLLSEEMRTVLESAIAQAAWAACFWPSIKKLTLVEFWCLWPLALGEDTSVWFHRLPLGGWRWRYNEEVLWPFRNVHILDFLNYFCNGQKADKWISTCFQSVSHFWWPCSSSSSNRYCCFLPFLTWPRPAVDSRDRINTDYSPCPEGVLRLQSQYTWNNKHCEKVYNRVGHQNYN